MTFEGRKGPREREQLKLEMAKRATTMANSPYTLGGSERERSKVTLPKLKFMEGDDGDKGGA